MPSQSLNTAGNWTTKRNDSMVESTPRSRCYYMPILLLFLYTNSCTWCFPATYTEEQCPAGINDVLEQCRCRQSSRGIYVLCKLGGSTYSQLPVLGQVNATILRLTLEDATVHRVPSGAFANLTVSTCIYLAPFLQDANSPSRAPLKTEHS